MNVNDSTMEKAMTAHDLLMTGLVPAVAMVVAIAAAVGVACSSGAIDGALETSAPPPAGMGRVAGPQPLVDHASVDWDKVPREPDPSPLSVAAYGD